MLFSVRLLIFDYSSFFGLIQPKNKQAIPKMARISPDPAFRNTSFQECTLPNNHIRRGHPMMKIR